MAVQELGSGWMRYVTVTRACALVASIALVLSLAAALAGIMGGGDDATPINPLDEVAARNERIAFFEQRARTDSLDYVSLNILAPQYLQRVRETGDVSDYARAEAAASRSLEILPADNYSGLVSLANVRQIQHDYDAALSLADQAIALKPWEVSAYGVRGDALLELGRYDEAEATYQQMVEKQGTLPSLSRVANVAFITNDLFNAEDFWKQSIDTATFMPLENLAWAEAQLGNLHFSQGDLTKARRQYEKALRTFPGHVVAQSGLARVEAAEGKPESAIALLEDVLRRRPEPQYAVTLGEIYAASGNTAKAEENYALVDAMASLFSANGISTDLQLSLFYADHDRDLGAALELASNAYAIAPSVYAADALAWALFKNGRVEDAKVMITQALREQTPEASFYYHAALISDAAGDRNGARQHLERALEINPHFSVLYSRPAATLLTSLKGAD